MGSLNIAGIRARHNARTRSWRCGDAVEGSGRGRGCVVVPACVVEVGKESGKS